MKEKEGTMYHKDGAAIKSERKPLPEWLVDVWYMTKNNNVVNPLGLVEKHLHGIAVGMGRERFYMEINDNRLIINKINADDFGFFAEEVEYLEYNNKYSEFEPYFGEFEFMEWQFDVRGCKDAIYRFMAKVLIEQPWYAELIDKELTIDRENCFNFFLMFLNKAHKSIPLLLMEKRYDYIEKMIQGNVDWKEAASITKKSIKFSTETELSISTANQLIKRHNLSEMNKFVQVLNVLNISPRIVMEAIDELGEINFTATVNYLIKQIIVLNNADWTCSRASTRVMMFINTYRDYLELTVNEVGRDMFPDDLNIAHEAAVDRHQFLMDGSKCDVEKYMETVAAYKDLEWEKDNLNIVIPSVPEDLVKESKALHHCVKTYIHSVETGNTKILLVRKDKKPYMTLEVKDNKIKQAKKSCNALPNEEDAVFLQEFAAAKNLEIISY